MSKAVKLQTRDTIYKITLFQLFLSKYWVKAENGEIFMGYIVLKLYSTFCPLDKFFLRFKHVLITWQGSPRVCHIMISREARGYAILWYLLTGKAEGMPYYDIYCKHIEVMVNYNILMGRCVIICSNICSEAQNPFVVTSHVYCPCIIVPAHIMLERRSL